MEKKIKKAVNNKERSFKKKLKKYSGKSVKKIAKERKQKNSEEFYEKEESRLKKELRELEKKYGSGFFAGQGFFQNTIPLKQQSKKKNPQLIKKIPKNIIKVPVKPTSEEVKNSLNWINKLKKEVAKAVIGQNKVVEGMIMGLLCNGHVLVEGVPGTAKTLAIRALSYATGCSVKRIQFTVDLLPTDITGISTYLPGKGFEIVKGPVFSNFVIADEINRSPPKTQSALIQAMQEKYVTIGKTDFKLQEPFFVMATENPIESAGVYPLPEAQIDRFLFKIIMPYPKKDEERIIMEQNMNLKKFEDFKIKAVISPKDIIKMQSIVKKVYMSESIKNYILDIIEKTRNKKFQGSEYLSVGVSPRATIVLFIASKARALMHGRDFVLPEDVKNVCHFTLRHRLILSYKATIQNVSVDTIIDNILNEVSVP